jgi:hypothetical protein
VSGGLKASPGCCEEASALSHSTYIPCNKPAARMVKNRDTEPYRMCEMCADHNVHNRGATDLGPYAGPPPAGKAIMTGGITAEELAAYSADAQKPAAETGDLLTRISNVVDELIGAREDVVRAQDVLKVAQQHVNTLEQYTLPELMREAGQEKLRTRSGFDVELGETLRASIPPDRLAEAIMWLGANGQGAIVKREIKLAFGKDEDQKAAEAFDLVVNAGYLPEDKQSVHTQTLGAAVREMIADGVDVPMEMLGVYIQPFVKVKEAKPAKPAPGRK